MYDSFGNLRQVTLPTGAVIGYVVDGKNRRVARKVNGAVQKGYLWQGQLRIVAELDSGGQVTSRFIYGTRVNVPEYMLKGGATYRLIADQLGSVRLVVNASTGAVAQRLDYDEFGVVTNDTNAGFQPFGFAGGLYDPDTRLVRFGARDYDAETGRWTGKDPIRFRGITTSLYDYCNNDPVNNIDSTGMAPRTAVQDRIDKFAAGALIELNDHSIYHGTERCGWIVENEDGSLSFIPGHGDLNTCDLGQPPPDAVAACHTHGNGGTASDLSEQDKRVSDFFGVPMYLANPFNEFKVYDPISGKTSTIGHFQYY